MTSHASKNRYEPKESTPMVVRAVRGTLSDYGARQSKTGYVIFMIERMKILRSYNNGESETGRVQHIKNMRIIGSEWKNLSHSERKPYYTLASEASIPVVVRAKRSKLAEERICLKQSLVVNSHHAEAQHITPKTEIIKMALDIVRSGYKGGTISYPDATKLIRNILSHKE